MSKTTKGSRTHRWNERIRETAQRLADIEFGDHGTLGGNADGEAGLVEFVHELAGADRLLFTELYLADLRIRLLSDDFNSSTRYKEQASGNFHPRL